MPTFEASFCAAEARALRFLVDDYGFSRVERTVSAEGSNWTGGAVRYRCEGHGQSATSRGWTVSLTCAPTRLELGLEVADEEGHTFDIEELHTLMTGERVPDGTHSLYQSSHNEEALFAEFNRLAMALKRSGERFFAGDRSLWDELQARRELRMQAAEDRRAVGRSETALRAEDWRQVVLELEPRKERLSKAAAARLAYAQKRLRSAA